MNKNDKNVKIKIAIHEINQTSTMKKEDYEEYLRQYFESYVKRIFGKDLCEVNLNNLFSHNGNERHQYPLYFLWILPEYTQWYLDNGKQSYMILGDNFAKHMGDLFQYNSFILDDLLKMSEAIISNNLYIDKEKVIEAKLDLGIKVVHLLEGSQKFLWSFVSRLEKMKDKIG
jgi:hypothetical protein